MTLHWILNKKVCIILTDKNLSLIIINCTWYMEQLTNFMNNKKLFEPYITKKAAFSFVAQKLSFQSIVKRHRSSYDNRAHLMYLL
jgi:hypothetical protein